MFDKTIELLKAIRKGNAFASYPISYIELDRVIRFLESENEKEEVLEVHRNLMIQLEKYYNTHKS